MEKQRLRNLTTGRLHTDVSFIYQDLEFITKEKGLMPNMLPNILRAVTPWLKENVTDSEYWDDEYRPELTGNCLITPMTEEEKKEFLARYEALPHPFEKMAAQS